MTRQPGKKGFCEDTAYDGATGRALARLAVPVGWSVVGRLERADSFERPISVRLRAEGPDGSSVDFNSGERYCRLGAGAKGMNVMAAMYGLTSSMQTSPDRAFEDIEDYLDKEVAAFARRAGGAARFVGTVAYPGDFDEAAGKALVEREAINDFAIQGARVKCSRLWARAAARLYELSLPDGSSRSVCAAGIVDGYVVGVPAGAATGSMAIAASELVQAVAPQAKASGFLDAMVDSGILGGIVGRKLKERRVATPSAPCSTVLPSSEVAAPAQEGFGKVGAGEVLIWGPRNVTVLCCPGQALEEHLRSTLPAMLRSFTPNPALAQEADAIRNNAVIQEQQQAAMAQQRQQARFAAMRQAVNTQRQAFDDYQRAAQARSDAQWAADRARSGHAASDSTWTDGFSDAMRGVNTWVRPDGTEVETSTASNRAWTNAAGDVVGGGGGFDPGAGWTELHQR